MLRDSNSILDNIVFPMSFPWNHHVPPVLKSVPFDIDDLLGSQTFETNLLDQGDFGKFVEVPTEATDSGILPSETRAAAKRTEDPGVILFTEISPPTILQRTFTGGLLSDCVDGDDSFLPGGPSLRSMQEARSKKRRREEIEVSNLKTVEVSIRFGSTSSRSSVLVPPNPNSHVLMLPALLPNSVHDGHRVCATNVEDITSNLGSYDCRFGLPHHNEDGDRVRAGRTRLVWSQAIPVGEQRVFRSILTGQTLENGSHKRPKNVRVGIRLNGTLLTSGSKSAVLPPFSKHVIEDAIEDASGPSLVEQNNWQCSLDPELFLLSVLKGATTTHKNVVDSIREPFAVTISSDEPLTIPILRFVPPKIDCLTAEDGLVYCVPTERGSLRVVDKPAGRAHTKDGSSHAIVKVDAICALADMSASGRWTCSICFSESRHDIVKCERCDLSVHSSCYGHAASEINFQCDACLFYDWNQPSANKSLQAYRCHRWQIACSLCKKKGGSIIRRQDGTWIHDVCRIWGVSRVPSPPSPCCALCNDNEPPVVQCCAQNCQVMFHPVCALAASNAAFLRRLSVEESSHSKTESDRDAFLCTQYRLALMQVGTLALSDAVTVPVVFCGHHNPDRQPDFRGLYPCAHHLANTMRLPPLNPSMEN